VCVCVCWFVPISDYREWNKTAKDEELIRK
jgi:hypothetical protein